MDAIAQSRTVGRQVALPVRKAAQIAWQSIRQRFARSLLVTSGIVLALAFLMAVFTTEVMTDAMRRWVLTGPASENFQRQQLASLMQQKGEATTPKELADAKLQSRWLVGLALLVAFVGILNSMLATVIDVSKIGDPARIAADIQAVKAHVKSARPAPGYAEVLTPGEPERRHAEQRAHHGIDVDETTWRDIRAAAESIGISAAEFDQAAAANA